MNHILFLIKQKLSNILFYLHEIPFNIRLKYLVLKYNGGKNIPAHELTGMINKDTSEEFHNCVEMIKAINEVCHEFNINPTDTITIYLIKQFIHNNSSDEETDKNVSEFLTKKPRRKAAYQFLLENKDIESTHVQTFLRNEDGYRFANWLKEE